MNCQILFSGENRNIINLMSAEFAHRVVKVKYLLKIYFFYAE